MPSEQLDGIVILGGGAAAAAAAHRLTQEGVAVTVLMPGEPVRAQSEARVPAGLSPKVEALIGAEEIARHHAVNRIEVKDFALQGFLAPGGLSRVWGAVAPRWKAQDFESFPLDGAAMEPHYDAVLARIFGQDTATRTPDAAFLSHPRFADITEEAAGDVTLEPAQNFVFQEARPPFGACVLCNGCFSGCRHDAIYRADLDLAQLSERIDIRHGITIDRLMPLSGQGYAITGYDTGGAPHRFEARTVLSALGAAPTTRLLGALLSAEARPRRIESTPGIAFALVDPRNLLARRASRFALAQIAFSHREPGGAEEVYGALYSAQGLSVAQIAKGAGVLGPVLRPVLHALHPALYLGLAYLPGSCSDNRLQFDTLDGETRMTITGGRGPGTELRLKGAVRALATRMKAKGLHLLPGSPRLLPNGGDSHYGAGLPMGSLTSPCGELTGFRGLHAIDGATLTTLSARHPTLTIIANADRIAYRIAQQEARFDVSRPDH